MLKSIKYHSEFCPPEADDSCILLEVRFLNRLLKIKDQRSEYAAPIS